MLQILGALKMRSYLSGMPELKLGLNDKVLFEQAGRSAGKGKAVDLEVVAPMMRMMMWWASVVPNALACNTSVLHVS